MLEINFGVYAQAMRKMINLDDFDRRLIALVREDNLQPARVLADKVGLSLSAVLRRLRRLREEKVIVADVAIIDPALTGSALTMHVLVRMHESGNRVMNAFAARIGDYREVTGAWEVTGEDDFVLKVQVDSMADYDAFVQQALTDDVGVAQFKTLITMRTIVEDRVSTRPLLGG